MKTLNTMEVRMTNAHSIIHMLEAKKVSTNRDLAHLCNMSTGTISNIVNLLKQKSIITEAGTQKSAGGRRAVNLSLNSAFGYFAGISIMKHIYYITVIDFAGKVINKEAAYLQFSDSLSYWAEIKNKLDQLVGHLNGIVITTIALPGFIDPDKQFLKNAPSLALGQISLKNMYNVFGEKTLCEDSARLSGMSQLFGQGNFPNSVYLMLSRRISGALIFDNEILKLSPYDCSFGEMIIDMSKHGLKNTASFSDAGTFASYCSSSYIIDILRSKGISANYPNFFDELNKGNHEYTRLWNEYIQHLAVGIYNIYAVLGLDIIIGGEMRNYIEPFFEQLCHEITVWDPDDDPHNHLMFSRYGEYDEAMGASLMARSIYLSSSLKQL